MIISKTVKSMLVAGTAAVALATYAMAEESRVATDKDGRTHVEVPMTKVSTGHQRGTQVKVRAPATKVDVDTHRGQVRIRAPHFNGDIRW